jgi:hypothetical protein
MATACSNKTFAGVNAGDDSVLVHNLRALLFLLNVRFATFQLSSPDKFLTAGGQLQAKPPQHLK